MAGTPATSTKPTLIQIPVSSIVATPVRGSCRLRTTIGSFQSPALAPGGIKAADILYGKYNLTNEEIYPSTPVFLMHGRRRAAVKAENRAADVD
jgi:hypothetical protein